VKHYYNVKYSVSLTNDLTTLKTDKDHRLITFNIKDLYVNILIKETLRITETLLAEHNNEYISKQINTLLEIILQQNCFYFQNNIYHPEKAVSMVSNTIAEIFLQCLENKHLQQTLEAKNIVFYTRYVDDILIMYPPKKKDHT
jgi:hypothetical protein